MLSLNRRAASSLASDFVMAFKHLSICVCSRLKVSARSRVASAWSLEALVAFESTSWASASCECASVSLTIFRWQDQSEDYLFLLEVILGA